MPKSLTQPTAPPVQTTRPASSYQRAPGSSAASASTAPPAPRLVRDPGAQRKQIEPVQPDTRNPKGDTDDPTTTTDPR